MCLSMTDISQQVENDNDYSLPYKLWMVMRTH